MEKNKSTYYRLQCSTAEATLRKRNLTPSEREEAEMWLGRKKRTNETARLRMKKMNDKKKSGEGFKSWSREKAESWKPGSKVRNVKEKQQQRKQRKEQATQKRGRKM